MRFLTYLALLAAAVAAFLWGAWLPALLLGGAKACLVGVEFMELRHAHPAHGIGFVLGIAGLLVVIAVVAAQTSL